MSKDTNTVEKRDGFQSKWGFILACIGSAVGMGNIWRFPIMVQQYGGMTFLLPYFLFVILIGSSGVIEEFALGRRAKAGPVGAFGMCTKERTGSDKAGKAIGAIPIIGALMLAIGYTVVLGWIFKYTFMSLSGSLFSLVCTDACIQRPHEFLLACAVFFRQLRALWGSVHAVLACVPPVLRQSHISLLL